MDKYVVNKRAQNKSGCHKIHTSTCAKEYFDVVNGCKYCCNEIFFKKN